MVLADSCRGCCLAMPSISVSYRECVTNRACQEGRNQDSPYLVSGNSAPFHTICPCVCACGVYQGRDPGPGMTCFPAGLPSGASREGARRAAVGRVAPTGRTCPQASGGNWPDGNTGDIDNYPVCLRHSGQQSHTYYCLLLSVSWFCRCPCHRATCVMTVSVSTLLTGKCIRNCLYLN